MTYGDAKISYLASSTFLLTGVDVATFPMLQCHAQTRQCWVFFSFLNSAVNWHSPIAGAPAFCRKPELIDVI